MAILIFVYLISQQLWYAPNWNTKVQSPGQSPSYLTDTETQSPAVGEIGWPPSSINSPKPAVETDEKLTAETDGKPATGPKPMKDAHKLPTADSFLSHFKVVTQMKGMTMVEAKSGCTWPAMGKIYFQYSEDRDWTAQDRSDVELEARRKQWHDFLENDLVPYEPHKDSFNGQGIVIVAGNERSLKRVKAVLRQLKKLGSQTPIELHFWDDEVTAAQKEDLLTMWPNLYFNDLSAPSNVLKTNHGGEWVNYQLKTAAIVNSRFAEPLMLDADNIPVLNPDCLWESDTYKEYGTLFWPDIARTRPNNPIWGITNTRCRMDEYEQESGQLLVDKRKFFYHLQLAAWFNNAHAEYYNQFLLGDKDLFRFAWHALKTQFGSPSRWITSVGTLTDGYYCGHSFAQHHPNGSVAFMHGGLVKRITPEVMQWQRQSRGGIYQVYKRIEHDEQYGQIIDVDIKWDDAKYLPNRPIDLEVGMCTDYFDVEPRPLDEIVPDFEKRFEEIGGYWTLDDP